jgi:hypothetical protein
MRRENTWETFLATHEVLQQEEQLALTAATGGRTKGVDRKWNQVPQWDNKQNPDGSETVGITLEGIIHWTGWGKPWHHRTKVWRPEVWEAERTNWEVLRAGEWNHPVMWELSGSPATELHLWFKRGWKLAVLRQDVPVPQLPAGTELTDEARQRREEQWQAMQAKGWATLVDHPGVELWENGERVAALGTPEVVVCRDLTQLTETQATHPTTAGAAPYVILRNGVTREVAEQLASVGYTRQWCRPRESAGAVAEGVDYLPGPWTGEIQEGAELLGWKSR